MSPIYRKPTGRYLDRREEELKERERNFEQAVAQRVGDIVSKKMDSMKQSYEGQLQQLQQQVNSLSQQPPVTREIVTQPIIQKEVVREIIRETPKIEEHEPSYTKSLYTFSGGSCSADETGNWKSSYDDGKGVEHYPSGLIRRVTYPNGSGIEFYPDGRLKRRF